MNTRPQFAEKFYSGDIFKQIEKFSVNFTELYDIKFPVACVVPHAGWFYSGKITFNVLNNIKLKRKIIDTIFLFGTVHYPHHVKTHSVYAEGSWETPIGELKVDESICNDLLKMSDNVLISDIKAHEYEHSIEVQLPFIKYFYPDSMIIPIAVLPNSTSLEVGHCVSSLIKEKKLNALVVGTTDLTHYGRDYNFCPAGTGKTALEWMHDNDRKIISNAINLECDLILNTALKNKNSCGPGALTATAVVAKKNNKTSGYVVDYSTSYEVYNEGNEFETGVGYVGIIY